MRRNISIIAFILFFMTLLYLGGCTHYYSTTWKTGISGIQLERLSGNAKYEVLGDTEGRANVSRILFFLTGDKYKHTNMIGTDFPSSYRGRAEQAAAYNAIENVEGADELLSPRFNTEVDVGFLWLWTTYTSTVKAKAIKIIRTD